MGWIVSQFRGYLKQRDAIVTITYAVVTFSILVQGLTINRVLGATADGESGRTGH